MAPSLSTTTKRQTFVTTIGGPPDADQPTATISTIDVDREHDVLIPEGADLRDFRRNPVVLFGHDHHSLPVGVATSIAIEPGKGIRASWRWLTGDPFADRVANAWNQRALNAISVGFMPKKRTPNKHGGWQYDEWTLLEFSVVAVPMNAAATRALKTLGLDGPTPVAHAKATLDALDAQLRDGRVLSRRAEQRMALALSTLRDVVRATEDDDALVLRDDTDDLAVTFDDDANTLIHVDPDALRTALRSVVDAEIARATGRLPDGDGLLAAGTGEPVIDMEPAQLEALIRAGVGAALDQKLKYVTGRLD